MSVDFLNFCSKQTREIEETTRLEAILAESINLARSFSEMSQSEFDAKLASELNGAACLAWIADYIAVTSEAYTLEKEWFKQLESNFSIAKEFFTRWKKKPAAEYLEIEGLW